MPKPSVPAIPLPPLRSNPDTFSARLEASLLFWQTFAAYLDDIADFSQEQADIAVAAAVGGDLPSLSGQAGRFLRVNEAGTAAEFAKALALASGADASELNLTTAGRAILEAADGAAQLALMGLAGSIMAFGQNTPPAGWLKANGAAVSRTTYAALFAAIGTTFGAGDGSTTFNVPDMRGEFPRGWDDGRGIDGGRAIGSAQGDANKAHTHTGSAASAGAHTHNLEVVNDGGGFSPKFSRSNATSTGTAQTESAGAHTHTLTIDSSGGAEARPRNIALLYCIKF